MKQNETKFCSFSIIYVKVLGELWFCKSGFKVTEKVVSSQLIATVFFKTKTINEIKKYRSTHWKVFYKISCSTFFPGGFLVRMLEKMSVKDFTLNKFTGPKLAILLKIELLHKYSSQSTRAPVLKNSSHWLLLKRWMRRYQVTWYTVTLSELHNKIFNLMK